MSKLVLVLSGNYAPPKPPVLLVPIGVNSTTLSVGIIASPNDGAGIQLYVYQRSLNGVTNWQTVLSANTTNFLDSGLQPNTTYYYQVQAVDNRGDASVFSSIQAGTTPPIAQQPPSTPTGFIATVISQTEIDLSWSASTGAAGIQLYELQRSTDNLTWTDISVALVLSFQDKGLAAGTKYFYRVRAEDTLSQFSGWATATGTTQSSGIPAASKIVRTDGLNGAFTTLQAAHNASVPGDIIECQSINPGQLQVLPLNCNFSKTNTAALPATVRVRLGDKIRFRPTPASTGIGKGSLNVFNFGNGAAYWNIQGDGVNADSLQIGDPADWINWQTGGDNGWANGYPHTYPVFGQGNAHHIWFRNFVQFSGGGTFDAVLFQRTTNYICFDDCSFRRHGTNYRSTQDPTGNGLSLFCEHYLIRRPIFDHFGGHDQFNLIGPWGWMREAKASGIWNDINPIPSSPTDTGYRCGNLAAGEKAGWANANFPYSWTGSPDPQVYGPIGLEGSFFNQTGFSTKRPDEPFHEVHSNGAIVRDNWYCDGAGHVWFYADYGSAGDGSVQTQANEKHQAHYHNTSINTQGLIYQNAFDWQINGTTMTTDNSDQNLYKNNVHQQILRDHRGGTDYIWLRAVALVPLNGWPDSWKGAQVDGNIYSAGADGNALNVQLAGTSGATVSISQAPTQWPAIFSNVTVASVTFNNAGSVGTRTQAGLTITAGAGFQDARPVTKTTGSGVNTLTLPVAYACFYDPENAASYNFSYFGEQNDFVGVGATLAAAMANVVQIASGSGTSYTLKTPISFSNGDGVWFAGNPGRKNGAVFHQNRGAV